MEPVTNPEFEACINLEKGTNTEQKKWIDSCDPCPSFREDYQIIWFDPNVKTNENQFYLSTLQKLGFVQIKTINETDQYKKYLEK